MVCQCGFGKFATEGGELGVGDRLSSLLLCGQLYLELRNLFGQLSDDGLVLIFLGGGG